MNRSGPDAPQLSLFFAFPDGQLAYDCTACAHKPCCRGMGFSIDVSGPQMQLLRQHPYLYLEGRPWAGQLLFVHSLPSGCCLLGDERCTQYGTAQRPASCRLFPFTQIGLAGTRLVIAPDAACPLTHAPGAGVSHRDLTALIQQVGIAVAPEDLSARLGQSRWEVELTLRDAAAACLHAGDDFATLCAFSLAATSASPATELERNMASAAQRLEQGAERWQGLVGPVFPERGAPQVSTSLLLWNSTLRLFSAWHDLATFPTAAYLLGRYLDAYAPFRNEGLPANAIAQLFSALDPLLFHAVHLAARARLPRHVEVPAARDISAPLLQTLQQSDGEAAGHDWGTLLATYAPSAPDERVVWLRRLAHALQGVLTWA
jgi:hypothetical protein